MSSNQWTVFVGGTEVADTYKSKERALELADDYVNDDYDEVYIVNQEIGEEIEVTK